MLTDLTKLFANRKGCKEVKQYKQATVQLQYSAAVEHTVVHLVNNDEVNGDFVMISE